MSTTTISGAQDLSQTLFKAIDTNGDNRLQATEFTAFIEQLVGSLNASQTNGTAASATTLTAAAKSVATGAPVGLRPVFGGFDVSRAESAKGTLKYDAYNLLQDYDPNDPAAMNKAYEVLSQMHPGQYELDSSDNLMLTGTSDGYIGSRPQGYTGGYWDDSAPRQWSWFWYNSAHPGPAGEVA